MSAAVPSHPRRSAFGAALAIVALLACPAAGHGAAGDLDPSFGTGGIARPGDAVSTANAMVLQPDGRIVLAGSTAGTGFDWRLTRLNADGSLDAGFGTGGIVTTDFGGDYDIANAVALQPDGRIVVAGTEGDSSGAGRDFAIARYNRDGSLDTGFGAGGRVTAGFGPGPDDAFEVVVQPDGKIVVAGIAAGDFGVLRLNADGSLDASFGSGGGVRTDVAPQDFVPAAIVQPDGRIVAGGGSASGASGTFSLVRYLTDGGLDPSFGTGGVVRTDVGPGLEFIYAMASQPDGKIVVTGPVQAGDFAVARYAADGDLDPTFGAGGIVLTDVAGATDSPSAVVVQPDGRIVVAGLAAGASGDDEDFALARYLADGTLDPSFGTGGKVTTDTTDGSDGANALALQPDGRILAAGSRFNVVRYLGDGGAAPTIALAGGACAGHNDASARLVLRVRDADTPAGALRVTAASSNPSVVPAGGLRLGGQGEQRTLDVAAARSGTVTVTVTVTDGARSATLAVRVAVGTPQADALGGTPGTDVLFGLAGKDDLRGAAGDDLLCGGNGPDRLDGGDGADGLFGQNGPDALTGGAGPDLFSGGRGPDAFADLTPVQGDRTDGT
jgi:uncharacterized delta-60 repeat protein